MDIKQIDNALFRIWKHIDLSYINPINQRAEKRKFFSSKAYNPRFKYRRLDFNVQEFKRRLSYCKKLLKGEEPMVYLLARKIDKLLLLLRLLESAGTSRFVHWSLKYYGVPSKKLVIKARKLVKIKTEAPVKVFSSKEAVAWLAKKAQQMRIGWKVKEMPNLGATIDDSAGKRTLFVKKGEFFSKKALERLAVHELGVHATRAENGRKQKYKLFVMGTANYEFTEEGLAAVMEERKGVSDPRMLQMYAGRVLAVHWSLTKSFRGVYNELAKYFPPEEAYQLTLRAKRGLSDTSKPGAFTKDYIYLYGRERLKKVKNLKPLFMGRIDIDDLKVLKGFL